MKNRPIKAIIDRLLASRKSRLGRIAQNSALLLVAVFVSLLIAEFALRVFTSHPVGFQSNKIIDPVLGYRLKPGFRGVDSAGFRNPEGKNKEYVIATIGDSHTYSGGVGSRQSWPRQLEEALEVPVYNYGLSSYRTYTYHPLVMRAIEEGARAVVVAIYLGNDLGPAQFCRPAAGQPDFWLQQAEKLGLDIQTFLRPRTCAEQEIERLRQKAGGYFVAIRSFWEHQLRQHWQSILADWGLESQARDRSQRKAQRKADSKFIDIPGTGEKIKRTRVAKRMRLKNFDIETTRRAYDHFVKFAKVWKELALENDVDLLFALIPTKEFTLVSFAVEEGFKVPPALTQSFMLEQQLIDKITGLADELDIPATTVLPELLQTKKRLMKNKKPSKQQLYPIGDGHPRYPGYRAYKDGVLRLVQRVCANKPAGCSYLPSMAVDRPAALH